MSANSLRKIDQKEYLKKYLSGDKVKKKKKDKKSKKSSERVKIIDDDVSHLDTGPQIDEELLLTGDDAPQIVGEYIEEDPAESKQIKWKSISIKEEPQDERVSSASKEEDLWGKKAKSASTVSKKRSVTTVATTSPPRRKVKKRENSSSSPPRRRYNSPSPQRMDRKDKSPHRRQKFDDTSADFRKKTKHEPETPDNSPPRARRKSSSDFTPPRNKKSYDKSRLKRKEDFEQIPPRYNNRSLDPSPPSKSRPYSPDLSPIRKCSKSSPDQSLSRQGSRREQSPCKRTKASPDRSPLTKRNSDKSPLRRDKNHSHDYSTPRKSRNLSADDLSPPRRKWENSDQSPRRKTRNRSPKESPTRNRRLPNKSPPRRSRKHSVDQSPPRRRRNSDQSPSRRNKHFSPQHGSTQLSNTQGTKYIKHERQTPDLSPRRHSRWEAQESEKSLSPPPTHKSKPGKTLEGKKAGLQNAQSLHKESLERRKQENLLFEKMSSDISGRHAEVQVRSTGRKGRRAREAGQEDPEDRKRREEHEEKRKQLYDRWGKGLKQIEDHQNRLLEEAYESNKPLARYKDDEDLERHLKEQERIEDPMLEYMRQKRREKEKKSGKPQIPRYEGPFPENRFGIRPGYRWDGVDRSNGYEKKYFAMQNEKRARQDEAYKYSVEDM